MQLLPVVSHDAKDSVEAECWTHIVAFVPADVHCLSSLRVASQHAKEYVDRRWWTAQVKMMKAFVDRRADLFPQNELTEAVSIEDRQEAEAFARNGLLWVKPLLVNQPWKPGESADFDAGARGEVAPQAAFFHLGGALGRLSDFGLF